MNDSIENDFAVEIANNVSIRTESFFAMPLHLIETLLGPVVNVGVGHVTMPNFTYVPNLVVLHPYTFTFEYFPVSLKFSSSFVPRLPAKIRSLLGESVPDVFLSIENILVENSPILIRPHYWLYKTWLAQHRDLAHYRMTTAKDASLWGGLQHKVMAGIFGNKGYNLLYSEEGMDGLKDFGSDLFMHPNDEGVIVVSTSTGAVRNINPKKTATYWSVVFDQTTQKFAVTWHWLVNAPDREIIDNLVASYEGENRRRSVTRLSGFKDRPD